jgi:hypothetical protein
MLEFSSNEQTHEQVSNLLVEPEISTSTIEIEEMPEADGLYNVTAWREKSDTERSGILCLLGRGAIRLSGLGKPDVTTLVYREVGPDGEVIRSEIVWDYIEGEPTLEDPRVLPVEGGLVFGLSAVVKEGEEYIPYPAIAFTPYDKLREGLRNHRIITNHGPGSQTTLLGNMAGKNTTVISRSATETTVMFRPEGKENNHRLRVLDFMDGRATAHQDSDIVVPYAPWATFRIGTTIPPVWLNPREGIFPLHGITIDGNAKDVYSIGAARLTRAKDGRLSIDNISQEPLVSPNLFNGTVERNPQKRALYCVGRELINDSDGNFQKLVMLVSAGDTKTFRVTLPKELLTQGWQTNNEPTSGQQLAEVA